MKTFRYIATSLIVLMLWGCKDILDTSPQQSVPQKKALNSSSNVKKVLKGAYNALGDGDVYGGRFYVMPDLMAAGDEVKYVGTQPPGGEIHRRKITVSNSFVRDAWGDSYETINIANNVLSALDVVDQEDRDQVEGEAKFIRGIVYFQLVRLFGKDYSDGDPSSNMGVPLKLKPTASLEKGIGFTRNSVAEVYAQVIKDLKDAESKLKEHPPAYVYADKYAASAFLARVYLQQKKYKLARDEANKVISEGPYSLVKDYADAFNNSSVNTSEDIFAMQVSNQDGANSLQGSYASLAEGGSNSYLIDVTKEHLQLYKPNDDRLNLFYKSDLGDWHTGKWKNQNGNVNVLRLAEMYLDRAECNKRLGTKVGATPVDDINTIRNRAGLTSVTSVTLDDILAQRHIELAFEGHFLFDLKRTQGSIEGTPWNAPNLVFPIPQRNIDANHGKLKQNEGYSGG